MVLVKYVIIAYDEAEMLDLCRDGGIEPIESRYGKPSTDRFIIRLYGIPTA